MLVLGALACALAARAQEPPPAVVFLVPPSPDEPEPREVFAPRELLERLERLARDPVPDVFLTDAVYEGRVAGDAALFEARFGVYCLGDGPAVLRLPLAGVRLREALLDGAAAYPRPGRGANGEGAAEDDYEFDLRGAGKHTLRLRFAVPVAGAGADREVRFQIPELVQSRLELESAAELPQLDVVNWRGARRLAAPGGGPVRLEADLGRSRVVHLRWRGRDPGDGAVVQARELLGLWELAPASARLWSVAHFRISQGSVAALRLAIPEELVIARLGVHPLDNPAGGVPAEWVKAWRLSDPAGGKKAGAGGYRSLTVELVAPVTGDVRVTLELVPREPLTARPVLRFPAAIPGTAAGETYVAVRSAGLAAAPAIEAEGAADYPAAAFLKEHWEPAQFTKLPAAPARAFRAERGQRPVLRPVLEPQPRGSRVEQELTWSLGEAVAVRAAMKWASPADDLLLLEWDVPEAVEVREVRGERLRSWSRDGTRVQAWLRAPAREASLEWFGSLARPARKRPPAREVVRLPAVRPRDADVRTALTVVPQPGWAVVPERLEGLRERPAAPGARALAFETTGPEPRSAFAVYPPRAPLPVRVEQRAAVEGRSLVFRAEVTAGLPGKRPHALTVACVPAPHDGALTRPVLSLEAPPGCRVSEEPGPDGGRAWTVDVPPVGPGEPPAAGKGRAVRVAVTGRLPLAGGVEWSVPRVRVSCGGEVIEPRSYRLRLGGPGLRVLAAEGLRERGKVAWEAAGRDWSLRVRASPIRLAGGPSAKAFACDVQVAPVGPRWACRAAIDLYHDAGTDLALRLPPGARLEALAVDGVPTDAGGREVRGPVPIPAPPGPGLRLVQALWTCAAEGDALRPPVLLAGGETVALPEVLWTTLPPVGRREDAPQAGSPARPLSAAERDLLRAEALLRALELLAPGPVTGGGERDAARSTLARCVERLRAAERRLSGGDTLPGGTGPLRDRLDRAGDELRRLSRALDAAAGEDRPTRSTAPPGEERTWSEMPFVHAFARGAPVRTRGAPLPLAAAAAPPAAPAGTDRPTLIRSAVLTALTALLLALSALTGPRTRPEQFALVGGIAAAVFPSPEGLLFLALPVLALAYRLLGLAARAGRLLLARA